MPRTVNVFLVSIAVALTLGVQERLQISAASAAPKSTSKSAPLAGGDDAGADLTQEMTEEKAPEARPVPPKVGAPAPVTFSVRLSENSSIPMSDVVWRVFEARASRDGGYRLVKNSREPRPTIDLNPGEYFVNVSYGRANVTKKIGVWPEKPVTEELIMHGGGLRLSATLAKGPIVTENLLKFEIYAESQDQFGNRQKLPVDLRPGVLIRLSSGIYHLVSTYGDGNSVIPADFVVEAGKITEVVIDHDAGKVNLKLVQRAGGEAVADARWTIFNATGDIVKESAGAFPTHILAAGDYRVSALQGDRTYSTEFKVAAGATRVVEVPMQQ